MKKQLIIGLLAIITSGSVMAQNAENAASTEQRQPKAPNERTKETILKLQQELGLSNDQMAKTYDPFFEFFNAQHIVMEEMRASGRIDREAMKEKRDFLARERDVKLKVIFTEEQMKKFKEVVEPAMRMQKRPEAAGKQ